MIRCRNLPIFWASKYTDLRRIEMSLEYSGHKEIHAADEQL